MIVILPLDQIGQEQAEYITHISSKPCFLNADIINIKVFTNIWNRKYTYILISFELAIGNKFYTTAINLIFKK